MKKIHSLPLKGLAVPFLLVLAFGCNNNASYKEEALSLNRQAGAADTLQTLDTTRADGALPQVPGMIDPRGLLLLKDASVEVTVGDMGLSARRLRVWLGATDGYYTLWTHRRAGDSLCLELTAKVPTGQFETFKDSVETLGMLVSETASATDETDDYAAAEAHQALSRHLSTRYDAVRGKNELLAIDRSAQLQTDAVDAAQMVAATNRHVAWATVEVRATAYKPLPAPEGAPFGRRLGKGFRDGWAAVEVVIVALAGIWPLLLLIAASVYFGLTRARRITAAPKAES